MYTIGQIEDGIITALAPLKAGYDRQETDPAVYGTVREIRPYQGQLDRASAIEEALSVLPALFVVYISSRYAEHGARKIETMRFAIFVCDQSLRVEADEARRGGALNPGVYALLNGIRDLLFGKQLSMEISPLKLLAENAEAFAEGLSVYSAEYETAQAHLYP
jgi:phage gp37-like protein